MRAVWSSFVVLCVVGFGVLGCKEEEASFELNSRRIAELASATCTCSDSVSNQTCAASLEDSFNANLLAQVQAGRIRVNEAAWGDCIAELRECELVADACEDLFEGALLENDACLSSDECAPGLRCVPDDDNDAMCSSVGTCEEIETFERGERCDREGECEGSDICGIATSGDDEGELVCRKPIEKGDPCPIEEAGAEGMLLCERGTACVPDGDEVVCGEPVAAGEPCTYVAGETSGAAPCETGNFCNAMTGVCEPFDFPEGGDVGDDCEMRSECLPGLTCIDDECSRPLANGSECDDDDQCAARCFEERCAATYVACGLP